MQFLLPTQGLLVSRFAVMINSDSQELLVFVEILGPHVLQKHLLGCKCVIWLVFPLPIIPVVFRASLFGDLIDWIPILAFCLAYESKVCSSVY